MELLKGDLHPVQMTKGTGGHDKRFYGMACRVTSRCPVKFLRVFLSCRSDLKITDKNESVNGALRHDVEQTLLTNGPVIFSLCPR